MPQNQPTKGKKTPLHHTQKARERIVIGLSWDAREDKVGKVQGILGTDSQHDLDISCYIYDGDGEFIDFVGAEAQDSMDDSGKIYHNGDNMCGAGEGDDEFISAELADIPAHVNAMVFLVEIRSRHIFSDINAPACRVADGMTDKNLLEVAIAHDDAPDKNAFVFCTIHRDEASPTGWTILNISEYPDVTQIEDWGSYLKQFVD